MAAKLNTFSGRVVLMIFVIFAISMPVLYVGVVRVVKHGMTHTFIDEVRSFSRVIADNIEGAIGTAEDADVINLLDSIVLGGQSNYAVIEFNGKLLESSLVRETEGQEFREDFSFGEHGDSTYYLSLPIVTGQAMGILKLGFDESPIEEHMAEARLAILYVLLAYLIAAVVITVILSKRIVRSIRRLRRASKQIASGDYEKTLDV